MRIESIPLTSALDRRLTLSPGQERTFELATKVASVVPIVLLEGSTGAGKTVTLHRLREAFGGVFLGFPEVMEVVGKQAQPEADGWLYSG